MFKAKYTDEKVRELDRLKDLSTAVLLSLGGDEFSLLPQSKGIRGNVGNH